MFGRGEIHEAGRKQAWVVSVTEEEWVTSVQPAVRAAAATSPRWAISFYHGGLCGPPSSRAARLWARPIGWRDSLGHIMLGHSQSEPPPPPSDICPNFL